MITFTLAEAELEYRMSDARNLAVNLDAHTYFRFRVAIVVTLSTYQYQQSHVAI